jgi:hypothetical protein
VFVVQETAAVETSAANAETEKLKSAKPQLLKGSSLYDVVLEVSTTDKTMLVDWDESFNCISLDWFKWE